MRSFFVFFTLFVFIVLSIPVYLLTLLIGIFSERTKVAWSQAIVAWAFKLVLFAAGAKVKVIGLENIPEGAVLFAGNHRSYADIPIIYTTTPKLTGFIAKKQIKKVPGLNWWMSNMKCLFLDRDDIKQSLKIILRAIDYVKDGYSMCVMPEGTRGHEKEPLPFKEGSFKIAEKSGCPIVPVAITHSDRIYELHQPWVKKTKLSVHYGEPIYMSELDKDQKKIVGQLVRQRIMDMLDEDEKNMVK